MHIWSALTGVAACLGRRVFLQRGHKQLYANQYVALVGPPGTRKSTAMEIMQKRLELATGIRFAPDDTAGQRQGLIKALQNTEEDEESDELLKAMEAGEEGSLEKLANRKWSTDFDPRDKHVIMVCAGEFNSFLGDNAKGMLPFLVKMYDGDNYRYKLKNEDLLLAEPLMTMIGCTTPTSITTSLPPEAIGQGFMSRVILVYSNKKYKEVDDPPPFYQPLVDIIEGYYKKFFYEFDGEMVQSNESRVALKELYHSPIELDDPRFLYYSERRHTHLLKLSIIMAASRLSKKITAEDVQQAHTILRATELAMPDALGEYGLSKVSMARQRMMEFLQHVNTAIDVKVLFAVMQKDMTFAEFSGSLADLTNSGKIKKVQTKNGEAYAYVDAKSKEIEDILSELVEKETDNVVVPLKRG